MKSEKMKDKQEKYDNAYKEMIMNIRKNSAHPEYKRKEDETMRKLEVKNYMVKSGKIDNSFRIVLLTDLHSYLGYGENNEELVRVCQSLNPDIITISGDLITRADKAAIQMAKMSEAFPRICRTYFAYGNHETVARVDNMIYYEVFEHYMVHSEIVTLNNASEFITVNGNNVCITGVELSLCKYSKDDRFLKVDDLPKVNTDAYHILLSHNPEFAETYFDYGADLTLSGHVHGGIFRIGKHGLLSPYVSFFQNIVTDNIREKRST